MAKKKLQDSPRKPSDFIYTYTGKIIDPEAFTAEDIDPEDIAYALSNIKRFNGHSQVSVLRHSLAVAAHFNIDTETDAYLWAILHDAAEAYLMDVPVPIKGIVGQKWAERYEYLEEIVCYRFDAGIPYVMHEKKVKNIDRMVVEYEMDIGATRDRSRMSYPCAKNITPKMFRKLDSLYMWHLSDEALREVFITNLTYCLEKRKGAEAPHSSSS